MLRKIRMLQVTFSTPVRRLCLLQIDRWAAAQLADGHAWCCMRALTIEVEIVAGQPGHVASVSLLLELKSDNSTTCILPPTIKKSASSESPGAWTM